LSRIKIGRNDPCPCGGGKKYKKCCLGKPPIQKEEKPKVRMSPTGPPPEGLIKAASLFDQKRRAKEQWTARYGHVRPTISADNWGKKFIAIGSRIEFSDRWKFVPDFLLDYVPHIFGKDWFDAEVNKPEAERHPVFQWRTACYRQKQAAGPGDKVAVRPDGMSLAYLSFAFNLFAIEDNSRLDDLLLQRLKHPEQFQGALHEVFAEATCLRAGFKIEKEDERDRATRHAEFTATDKATGEMFSVEAKSKHRAGVLGQAGTPQPHEKLRLQFGHLINVAVAKKPKHPLVIFLETNLPFRSAHHVFGNDPAVPSKYIKALCDRISREHGGKLPFAMLVLTNTPSHYGLPQEQPSPNHVGVLMTEPPGTNRRKALQALYDAVPLHGNIPNEFPEF